MGIHSCVVCWCACMHCVCVGVCVGVHVCVNIKIYLSPLSLYKLDP